MRWKMLLVTVLVVLLLAVVGGASGIFFGLAFRQLGEFHLSLPFVVRWLTNPFIVLAFVTGIAARLFYYLALKYLNVSQIALLSTLGLVATLVMAKLVLGDRLTPTQAIGSAFILVGAVLVGR